MGWESNPCKVCVITNLLPSYCRHHSRPTAELLSSLSSTWISRRNRPCFTRYHLLIVEWFQVIKRLQHSYWRSLTSQAINKHIGLAFTSTKKLWQPHNLRCCFAVINVDQSLFPWKTSLSKLIVILLLLEQPLLLTKSKLNKGAEWININ